MPYHKLTRKHFSSIVQLLQLKDTPDNKMMGKLLSYLIDTKDDALLDTAQGLLIFGLLKPIDDFESVFYQATGLLLQRINSEQQLIDISAFYHFVTTTFSETMIPGCLWNKQSLEENLNTLLELMLADKFSDFKSSISKLDVLRVYIHNMPALYYEQTKDRSSQTEDRELIINFIRFVDKYCIDTKISAKDEHEIRLGLLLFVTLHIDQQYKLLPAKGSLFNPGSQLYRDCLWLLNVSQTSDIKLTIRINLMDQLFIFLNKAIPAFLKANDDFQQDIDIMLSKKELDDINQEVSTLRDHFYVQLNQLVTAMKLNGVSKTISQVVKENTPDLSLAVVCTQAVRAAASYFNVSSFFITAPITVVLYVYSGQIGTTVYDAMKNSTCDISKNMVSLYSRYLNKFSSAVGKKTEQLLKLAISPGREGFLSLTAYLDSKDKELFFRWINTILGLPMVSVMDKSRVRMILGLAPNEKLRYEKDEEKVSDKRLTYSREHYQFLSM